MHSANILGVKTDEEGAMEMARRSRGTPRLANRLLKRVASEALDLMDVDRMGLDHVDQNLIKTRIYKVEGGPVGLDTIAAAIGEDSGTIEDVYEPYLIMNGLINRTPRGRVVTKEAYEHFGITQADNG